MKNKNGGQKNEWQTGSKVYVLYVKRQGESGKELERERGGIKE